MRLRQSPQLLWTCLLASILLGPASDLYSQQKPKVLIPPGTKVTKDIVYAQHDGVDLLLDLYLPKSNPEEKLPTILWVHGGGWLKGDKKACKAAFLTKYGFAVASINYRLTDVAQWPAQIEDCYAAVRWVRKNAEKHGLDPDKIGAWGSSAGGHLVALMGTRPAGEEEVSSRVQAVCDWFGPTDLLTMPPNLVSETRTLEQVSQSNGAKLLGATVQDVPELAKDASALYHVSEDDPPFLIMHGENDPGVPLEQSKRLQSALAKQKIRVNYVIVEGAGHGGPEFTTPAVLNTVRNFFRRQLR